MADSSEAASEPVIESEPSSEAVSKARARVRRPSAKLGVSSDSVKASAGTEDEQAPAESSDVSQTRRRPSVKGTPKAKGHRRRPSDPGITAAQLGVSSPILDDALLDPTSGETSASSPARQLRPRKSTSRGSRAATPPKGKHEAEDSSGYPSQDTPKIEDHDAGADTSLTHATRKLPHKPESPKEGGERRKSTRSLLKMLPAAPAAASPGEEQSSPRAHASTPTATGESGGESPPRRKSLVRKSRRPSMPSPPKEHLAISGCRSEPSRKITVQADDASNSSDDAKLLCGGSPSLPSKGKDRSEARDKLHDKADADCGSSDDAKLLSAGSPSSPAVSAGSPLSPAGKGKGRARGIRKVRSSTPPPPDQVDGTQAQRRISKSPRPSVVYVKRRSKGTLMAKKPLVRTSAEPLSKPLYTFCRIRPMFSAERSAGAVEVTHALDKRTVEVHGIEGARFKFDEVVSPGTQKHVFEKCRDIVQGVVDGYHGSIFSYGQTRAGKSFTMCGMDAVCGRHGGSEDMPEGHQSAGIMAQAIQEIFSALDTKVDGPDYYSVVASAIGICNAVAVDLLKEFASGSDMSAECGQIRMDSATGLVVVQGLTEHECIDSKELMEVLRQCHSAAHRRSHRSSKGDDDGDHDDGNSSNFSTIFMVTIIREDPETQERVTGKLVMCDLVSSDQPKGTEEKSRCAYNELTALREVLESLGPNFDKECCENHVLTRLLRDVLGGVARTAMIVNCAPTMECRGESLRSLQYYGKIVK